jgi:hypothetical protein
MRVRVLKRTSAYWNYSVHSFEPGDELDGDLARHLADNAQPGTVDVLEDDRPGATPDQVASQAQVPAAPGAGAGELDIDAKADAVLAWVGDDPDRARQGLQAESAKDKPRSTLVKALEKIASAEPGQE